MNLRERLSHFWNETLGVDYPETENIEQSNSPEYDELKASLSRVQAIEEKFSKPSTGPSTGKKAEKAVLYRMYLLMKKLLLKLLKQKKETKSKLKKLKKNN